MTQACPVPETGAGARLTPGATGTEPSCWRAPGTAIVAVISAATAAVSHPARRRSRNRRPAATMSSALCRIGGATGPSTYVIGNQAAGSSTSANRRPAITLRRSAVDSWPLPCTSATYLPPGSRR